MKKILVGLMAFLLVAGAAQAGTSIWGATDRGPAVGTMRFPVDTGASSGPGYLTLTETNTFIDSNLNLTGDVTTTNGVATTLATVNSNVGSFGSTTAIPQFTVDAKGRITAASNQNPIAAPIANLTGGGTGVTTALGVNIGSAGAPVLFNGAGGTPSSLTCTNCSGTAASLTAGIASAVAASGITGNTLASGVTASSLTSFGANPAIGAATATTPTTSDNNTNVATTAYVRAATAQTRIKTLGFSATTPTTGIQGTFAVAPCAGTITAFDIIADAGTATVQTYKIATGTTAPTVSNSISTAGVQLSTGTAIHSTSLGDFTTTTVAANDMFQFNLSAVATATKLYFDIQISCTN